MRFSDSVLFFYGHCVARALGNLFAESCQRLQTILVVISSSCLVFLVLLHVHSLRYFQHSRYLFVHFCNCIGYIFKVVSINQRLKNLRSLGLLLFIYL